MKIGFFTPYLDIMGGGEKYLLDIAKACLELGHEPILFWKNKEILSTIIERFGVEYSGITVDTSWHSLNSVARLIKTKQFAVFFYHPDGSYFMSWAKKNYALLQVPEAVLIPNKKPVNTYKFNFWIPVYNSQFTKRFFEKNYKEIRNGIVLYPTVNKTAFVSTKKEKIILSVGRFYEHLHSKKQDILVQTFIKAQKETLLLKEYRLVLAGTYKEPDGKKYAQKLKELIGKNTSIELRFNITARELSDLYKKAEIYWHATGYGADIEKQPQLAEHFGISIIEAMSYGAIPIAYSAGGPTETIVHGKTGFLFKETNQLIEHTSRLLQSSSLYKTIQKAAYDRAQKKFGSLVFKEHIQKLLL